MALFSGRTSKGGRKSKFAWEKKNSYTLHVSYRVRNIIDEWHN